MQPSWPETNAARVRVLATDGVHTSLAHRTGSRLRARSERSSSAGASDGQIVLPGTVLAMRADYQDVDGDLLADADFIWRSDAVGVLGSGAQLDVAADSLPAGAQVLSVTIPGKLGPPVSRSVRVLRAPRVGEIVCPGRLRRRWGGVDSRARPRRWHRPRTKRHRHMRAARCGPQRPGEHQ
jgi:hypothetical protein